MTTKITDEEARRLSGDGANTPPGLEAPSRSEGDLNRNSYRRSNVADRLAARAVVNDDGTPISAATVAALVDLIKAVEAETKPLLDADGNPILSDDGLPITDRVSIADSVDLLVEEQVQHEPRPRRSVDPGEYVKPLIDNHGRPYVRAEIHEPLDAFGLVSVSNPQPLVQLQFPYSVNARLVESITAGSGTATVSASLLTVATGTTTASDALLQSSSKAHYHPGQGLLVRFTALFDTTPVAVTEAICGLGNEEDFVGFGYDGTVFSILHRTGGILEHRTLTFTTGAVTASGTITITLDDDATTVEVVNGDSVQAVARAVGAVTFAEWDTIVIGDAVIFTAHHAEVKGGTFSFADTDTTGVAATGGVVQTITGIAHDDKFTPQADWNADKMNGTNDLGTNPSKMKLVPSNGNSYQIQIQDGFGDILFSIENENTGRFHLVHRLKFANAKTAVNIANPSLPLYIAVDNEATTSNITVKTSSMAAYTEGPESVGGLNNAAFGTATGDLTTETAVLAILIKPIFQGVENRVEMQPQRVTFSANGAGAAKFTTLKVHLNPILGGDPSFTDVSTPTSIVSFDTAGTTVSGGNVTFRAEFGADVENFTINLQEDVGPLPPETLIVFAVTIDGGTSDVNIGVSWRELF